MYLRETSAIFALLPGVLVLVEKLSKVKVVATIITLVGVVLMKIA